MVSRMGYRIRIFRATIASRAIATRQRINSVLSTMVPIASEPLPELNQAFSHGQTIQTGAFFCVDGSGRVHRVWRDGRSTLIARLTAERRLSGRLI